VCPPLFAVQRRTPAGPAARIHRCARGAQRPRRDRRRGCTLQERSSGQHVHGRYIAHKASHLASCRPAWKERRWPWVNCGGSSINTPPRWMRRLVPALVAVAVAGAVASPLPADDGPPADPPVVTLPSDPDPNPDPAPRSTPTRPRATPPAINPSTPKPSTSTTVVTPQVIGHRPSRGVVSQPVRRPVRAAHAVTRNKAQRGIAGRQTRDAVAVPPIRRPLRYRLPAAVDMRPVASTTSPSGKSPFLLLVSLVFFAAAFRLFRVPGVVPPFAQIVLSARRRLGRAHG
jgi:hypothetical protein